ncbi:fla cluster protein FlaF [Halorussus salilacus]|uniref:fla cluster protein FlaF n=1 Tax=Halorussus salilacus TaxID=2953750 RepID=UPI00209C6E83|nr:fla cluster protein FlaF [Halorussus salilacus]USZ68126.1 fla cluster protein FlaF [Halorussus salilacus]
MGFSVSGATVVLFLGIVISFGMAYTAGSNGLERVTDAYQDTSDDELVRQNTQVGIADAAVANQDGQLYLNATATNDGSSTLSVSDTDILIDGNYISHTGENMTALDVDGNDETDLWMPGETLRFNVSVESEPDRVKVVTGPGVSAAGDVTSEEGA